MSEEWYTNADLVRVTGLKYKTLYSARKRNTLPEPDQYIGRTPTWKRSTIDQWWEKRSGDIEVNPTGHLEI
jgi:predicted DNA-binding transcriptional regulator AlpA